MEQRVYLAGSIDDLTVKVNAVVFNCFMHRVFDGRVVIFDKVVLNKLENEGSFS